jgi:hypothetical protein
LLPLLSLLRQYSAKHHRNGQFPHGLAPNMLMSLEEVELTPLAAMRLVQK